MVDLISDQERGSSVRAKLNSIIGTVNTLAVDAPDIQAFVGRYITDFAQLATNYVYSSPGAGQQAVAAGDVVVDEKTGNRWEVLASGASGAHLDYTGTGGVKYRTLTKRPALPGRPAYLDQFVYLHGRGQLASETIRVTTEGTVTTAAIADAATLIVSDNSVFTVEGMATVLHSDGVYRSYTVTAKGSGTIAVSPPLAAAVSAGAPIERTWYDRAHAGKFYQRDLAQRVARLTEIDGAIPWGDRTAFSLFETNPIAAVDALVSVSGGTINYFATTATGSGSGFPPRFLSGARTAYVGTASDGQGAETPLFAVTNARPKICRVQFQSMTSLTAYQINIIDQDGAVLATKAIPAGLINRAPRFINFAFSPRLATQIKVRITAISGATTSFIWDMVDVFDQPENTGLVIDLPNPKIVCVGHSWVAGDVGATPNRESWLTQLAIELPNADIVNAGVGGDQIDDVDTRFEADVVAEAPDYVIFDIGVNDCYSPPSSIFDPNSLAFFVRVLHKLVNRCVEIGARPIVIGLPPLGEDNAPGTEPAGADADPNVSPYPTDNWALNNRARQYVAAVLKSWATQPALPVSSSDVDAASWTPTDQSGAGITFAAGTTGRVSKIGRLVIWSATIVMPSTSDTTEAVINLPYAADAAYRFTAGGRIENAGQEAFVYHGLASASTASLRKSPSLSSGAITWANMTSRTILLHGHYFAGS